MAVIDGFPAQSGVVDPVELRKELAGLVLRDLNGIARAGIFPRHTNALVGPLASMNVSVAAFEGICVRGGGPIFIANDGSVNVAIAAAPVSNSRIDVVYVRQKENGYGGFADGSNGPEIAVVTGIAGAVPAKPAIPTGALELATVLVPAGVAATNAGGVVITQTFTYTTTAGGVLLARTTAELPLGLPKGTRARTIDLDIDWVTDGGTWTRPSAWARFKGTITTAKVIVANQFLGKSSGSVTFNSTDDPSSAFSTATGLWTVPPNGGGTYLMMGTLKSDGGGTSAGIAFFKNGTKVAQSPNAPTGSFNGMTFSYWVRVVPGDTLGMQATSGLTTVVDSADNNYFEIVQVQS